MSNTNKQETVATIFVAPGEESKVAADLLDHAVALVEHRLELADLRHDTETNTRARRVVVTVSLEDVYGD